MKQISKILEAKLSSQGTRILNKNIHNILEESNKALQVEYKADQLVERFESPAYKKFFLRAVWRLSEDTINRYVAASFELGRNPRAYFIHLVRKDPQYHA